MSSPYKDIRSDFFKTYFDQAHTYDEYVTSGTNDQLQKWNSFYELTQLTEAQHQQVQSFTRKMHVLVMSGVWCGDCIRQGPMLRRIEEASEGLMEFRFIDNKENPELMDELRINGAQKVPVIVALSEDWYEVARFGDRHLSVYRQKAESELGAACDAGILPPSTSELGVEVGEWIDFFERGQLMLRLAPALRKRHGD